METKTDGGRLLLIISDLHISAGPLDDFDKELEDYFCKFLDDFGADSNGVELVINGDFLDFVQAEPWEGAELSGQTTDGLSLSFTEKQSLAKLNAIHSAHKHIFARLSDFLKNGKNKLTILPGNHDADFFWPNVRKEFGNLTGALSNNSGLAFCLDQIYTPEGFPGLHIEHGHQYDQVNSFYIGDKPCWNHDSPPIFRDSTGVERLLECVGTSFLVNVINKIDEGFPLIDNVKPFSRFLHIFGKSALRPGYAPVKEALAVWRLFRYVAAKLTSVPGDILSAASAEHPDTASLLSAWINSMNSDQKRLMMAELRQRGYDSDLSLALIINDPGEVINLMNWLSENPEVISSKVQQIESDLSISASGDELTLGRGFFIDESQELFDAGTTALGTGSKYVVMGHTHEPMDNPKGFKYINTGCWTRYYRFSDKEKMPKNWESLRANASYKEFPFALNFCAFRQGEALDFCLKTYATRVS